MKYDLPHFTVDRTDFLKGGNSFDSLPDGGILKSYRGYNPFSKPGYLTIAPDLGSVASGSLPRETAISFAAKDRTAVLAVGANNLYHGYFFSVDVFSGVLTQVGAADTTRSYSPMATDSVWYNDNFFVTSSTNIAKMNYDLTGRDDTWWTGTKAMTALGSGKHAIALLGDIMYITDGRYVHQNDHSTTQYNVLDFGPDWKITEMVQFSGKLWITVYPYSDQDGFSHGGGMMVTWNGTDSSWDGEWPLDYMVNAMYVFDQTLYMWTNHWMGYWDGIRMKRLYPMKSQIQRSQVTTVDDSLVFVDNLFNHVSSPGGTAGGTIVRHGAPSITGRYSFTQYVASAASVNGILSLYDLGLIITTYGSSTGNSYYIEAFNDPGTGSFSSAFNSRVFSKPIKPRGVVIELGQPLASGQGVYIQYIDDKGNLITTNANFSYASYGSLQRYRFDWLSKGATNMLYPYITITGGLYINKMDFLYSPSEWPQNK